MGARLKRVLRDYTRRYDNVAKDTDNEITLPTLYPLQKNIVDNLGRTTVLCAGRRVGKSYLASYLLLNPEYGKYNRLYTAPTHRDLKIVFDAVVECVPYKTKINRSSKVISLPEYEIHFSSFEAIDRVRGNKYCLAIIDEAAFCDNLEYGITKVIKPSLLDYAGDTVLLSTPNGRNFFYEQYSNPDNTVYHYTSYDNPFIDNNEIDSLRNVLPDRAFRQEIMAEFIGEGKLFGNIDELCTGLEETERIPGNNYTIGIDIAFEHDYTVFIVLDTTRKKVVRLMRGQWKLQMLQEMVIHLNEIYQPSEILIDSTGIGLPVVQYITPLGLPITAININQERKNRLIQNTMLLMENKEVELLNHRQLIRELSVFEEKNGKYNAPNGENDDCVIALALALWSIRRVNRQLVY